AGKADVSHGVDSPQPVHDEFADLARRPLAVRRINQKRLRLVDDGLKVVRSKRAFAACQQQPAQHLVPLKTLAPSILFHYHVWDLVDPFIGGEALLASLALAASSDGVGFLALA